jgi:hypothetical protein
MIRLLVVAVATLLLATWTTPAVNGFGFGVVLPLVAPRQQQQQQQHQPTTTTGVGFGAKPTRSFLNRGLVLVVLASTPSNSNEEEEESAWFSELMKMAEKKGVSLSEEDLEDDDEDEDEEDWEQEAEEEDDEEEQNYPQGAVNAFLGYDAGNVGDKLAGNVSLTNTQLYSEVKERVLDTAGGFLELVREAKEDDEDDDNDDKTPKPYQTPTTVPDSDLTAGEMVITVLEALRHNDNPTPNRGVQVLFGYSSSGSQIKNQDDDSLTPLEYAEFLKETEYKVLFEHQEIVRTRRVYSCSFLFSLTLL